MAGVKISQLQDGGALQSTDAFPVARGSFTRKIAGSELLTPANFNVADSPTIDLDWNSTTRTLSADVSTAVKEASAFNVVDSPTIDLSWDSSTRTLSADVKNASVTNAKIAFDGGSFCFRNKIINGGMEIDQRKAGAAHTITAAASQVYSLDRWYGSALGASTTHQRVAITNIPRLSYALRITGAAGNTNTWAAQRIESSTSSSLAGLSATLSFYAASNALTQLLVGWGNTTSSTPDDWSLVTPATFSSQNVSVTSTLTRYSITFIAPAAFNKGSYISFYSNGPLLAGQTITITGVQLEEGPTATPFEHRPIGTELALCQRYYEKSYNIDVAPGTVSYSGMRVVRTYNISLQTSNGGFESIHFSNKKRSAPAIIIYSPQTGTKNRFYDWTFVDRTAMAYNIGDGGFEPGYVGPAVAISAPTYHWTADAEL